MPNKQNRGKDSQAPRQLPKRWKRLAMQFLVILTGTDPLIWRQIQVPERYSFWDLHVAIQDAMGWLDCHLHEFQVLHHEKRTLDTLGIPDDEGFTDEENCLPSWEQPIATYFNQACLHETLPARYLYDFGDNWRHIVLFEGIFVPKPGVKYPRCVGGARACPPEDCGGVGGFADFLTAIADPHHPKHAEMIAWSGPYDPAKFDPHSIVFDNPRQRWENAFQE